MIVNTTYALVWNRTQGIWQAVGERTRRRGKSRAGLRGALAAVALAGGAVTVAHALPAGEKIVSGKADVLRYDDGRQMSINQHSDKLLTEWTSFGVDAGQRVTFNQPSAASVALNRVVGNDASRIHGSIDASGRVFLVNPNGVLFGRGARVNVGGLVATTLDIKNEDFEAGRYRFSGSAPTSIVNDGDLIAGEGGAIALLGAKVFNRGVVQAQLGTVALGAGSDITLNFDGGRLLSMQIDQGAVEALASNAQLLKADGGQVLMSAKTASDLAAAVVNNQGSLEARTLRNTAGRITLDGGERGAVNVAGVLNASASTPGDGGTIVTRGADVQVALGAMADTRATNGRGGVWRIAATDLAVKPGANQSGTIVADTLSRNLATTDIELVAERGGLSVEGPVAWASGNRLSLASRAGSIAVNGALRSSGAGGALSFDAAQDVRIAAPVAVTGANGRVTLNYGGAHSIGNGAAVTLSGANPGFESNGFRYTVIQNLTQLQAVNANLGGLFVLGNDIGGPYYYTTFRTIGSGTAFSGTFDGLGNTIGRLSIMSGDPYAGLFGLNTGRIANLKLQGMVVSSGAGVGPVSIGALAGENRGSVANVTVTGSDVKGGANRNNALGGLIGVNRGTIEQASFAGTVTGNNLSYAVGGLVGENDAALSRGVIAGGTSNATVSGGASNLASIGGLVGINRQGEISDAVSLGSTSGKNLSGVNVGGLVGANQSGTITRGTASGRTAGGSGGTVGGLAGFNSGAIARSEAWGIVDGGSAQASGGFVGLNQGEIRGSRALGAASNTGTGALGGFVGINQGHDSLIDMAEAHGVVTGGQGNTGGFVGSHLGGEITHAVARGKTSGGGGRVGGFAGYNAATLAGVDASGEVAAGASSSVGGFAGYNATSGVIASASATGSVTGGQSSTVGGLIGDNLGIVRDASASGAVGGGCVATLGGLVGMNMGLVERSAASGRVNGSSVGYWRQTYGGLVGINRGTFRYSHTSGEAAQQQLAGLNLGVIE